MSGIPRVFRLQLWNLAVSLTDMLFLAMGFISLVDEIQFVIIRSRHICIRSMIDMNSPRSQYDPRFMVDLLSQYSFYGKHVNVS